MFRIGKEGRQTMCGEGKVENTAGKFVDQSKNLSITILPICIFNLTVHHFAIQYMQV